VRQRIAVAALALSALGFVGIVSQEGYTDRAIRPVPGDVPTNGFGSTLDDAGQPLKLGDKTDPVRATRRAVRDLALKEQRLKQCLGDDAELFQHEYDAYMDLSYNVGPEAVCRSSIVRKVQAGQHEAACNTLLDFRKVQGRDCSASQWKTFCGGVWTRRQEMAKLCLTGEYPAWWKGAR
jgi:lysozyme